MTQLDPTKGGQDDDSSRVPNAPAEDVMTSLESSTVKRVAWRLLPILMLGYFCSFLDRSNVGMAAPTLNAGLHFSNAVFGFGTGLFFLGYSLAEIPSNLFLAKMGARIWLARIMITWGIVSGLTAFVWNDWSFYGVRLLLGIAEAGFFPGVAVYLTWWFPSRYGSRILAIFYCSSVGSLVVGPVISGFILQLNGFGGLFGWQWLFVIEAFPPVIMGVVTWLLLTSRPEQATWLAPEQRDWLVDRLSAERVRREAIRKFSLSDVFRNGRMWLLAMAWFGHNVASYALVFFLPLIVHGLGVSNRLLGTVSALPYVFALCAMILCSWHSDKTGERPWHIAGPWLVCSAGLAACVLIGTGHPQWMLLALIVAITGSWALVPVFWSLSSNMLTGTAAAAGIAMINSIGNLGGWFGPYMFGVVKDMTGSSNLALLFLGLAPVIAAVIVLAIGHDRRLEQNAPSASYSAKIAR